MPDDDAPRRPLLRKKPRDGVATDGVVPADSIDGPDRSAVAAGDAGDDDGDGGATAASETSAAPEKRRAPLWLETAVLLVVALGMALIIKTFLVQAFYIPSASMEPGLVENDRILVQKVSYWFGGSPSRGDVIVFEDPGDWLLGPEVGPQTLLAKGLAKIGLYPTGGHLVKRVIGLPGDTIECCDEEGHLIVNGVAIDEDDFIRPQPDCDGPMVNACQRNWTVTVPDDRLFVMGDNRAASADSSDRLCKRQPEQCDPDEPSLPKNRPDKPFVPMDNVVGKVFSLVWPLGHAEFIGRPDVFEDVPDPK
ncbi:signal peptidase I [Nocardioides sp.]|uniref:signal peptidase I n=1 Tax=Nocardioides sp. TaxID=35761 RepID=UPI002726E636|nr:signal peptidase I [Nocardioides sp.]MDO9456269.1 signal peptidase I [Nocardioides sp.]